MNKDERFLLTFKMFGVSYCKMFKVSVLLVLACCVESTYASLLLILNKDAVRKAVTRML